ncbi:hypothetical protein PV08_08593 [Exophiala spinifera]|uniref:Uncharacterized protein n=1 Tax=Exophiala spinifera TaxID=91928 RepID=A0A0D2B3Z4_9EURO|nr:uncharacterized protein PV08_08593 [Exophiala spinifera]KIW13405.1 hypothetical protein PV08_08593 [Exophiala spinifera]
MLFCILVFGLLAFCLQFLFKKIEQIIPFPIGRQSLPGNTAEGRELEDDSVHRHPGNQAVSVDDQRRTRYRRGQRGWEHVEQAENSDILGQTIGQEGDILQNIADGYSIVVGAEQRGPGAPARAAYDNGARALHVNGGDNINDPPPAYTFTNQVPAEVDDEHPRRTPSETWDSEETAVDRTASHAGT